MIYNELNERITTNYSPEHGKSMPDLSTPL